MGQRPGPRSQQPLQAGVKCDGHHWPGMAGISVRINKRQCEGVKSLLIFWIKFNAIFLTVNLEALSAECGLAGVCMTPWAITGPAQSGSLCSDPSLSALWESRSPSHLKLSEIKMIKERHITVYVSFWGSFQLLSAKCEIYCFEFVCPECAVA